MGIVAQIAAVDAEIAALKERREQLQRKRMITCMHCAKRTRIDKLTFIRRMAYEEPYGCSGGGHYYFDEGCFECPKCTERNRLLVEVPQSCKGQKWSHPDSEELCKLQGYFAEVVKDYKRS